MKVVLLIALVVVSTLEQLSSLSPALEYRIIGGEKVAAGFAPYSVSIQPLDSSMHLCGGAIIASRWIVTASHCVFNWRAAEIVVVTGTNQWAKPDARYYVEKVVTHCNYDHRATHDDIALLQLRSPIVYDEKTQPVALPSGEMKTKDGEGVTLTGWGDTEHTFEPRDQYRIELKYLPRRKCMQMMKAGDLVDVGQICTFTRVGEGTCRGDSGAPLVSAGGRLVGVVNGGEPCAVGYPDVYANVFFYTDWIRSTIGNASSDLCNSCFQN